MTGIKGNTLGALAVTELLMGILQTATSVALYAVAAIATGPRVSGPRYVIVNLCFTVLLFGQIIAAVAYDRGGQLDAGVGTRLLEEAALWYVRLYLIVKPAFAVASTLIDLVILKIALILEGYKSTCSEVGTEMRRRLFGLHNGRFGRAEFLYGWQDVKQTACFMVREFGRKPDPDGPGPVRVYYRDDMMFEVIDADEEGDNLKTDAKPAESTGDVEGVEQVV